MATEARDPTGPGGTTSGGSRAGDRASRAGGRGDGGRGSPLGSSGRTGPRDPTGPGGTISGGTRAGDRAARAGGRGDGGRLGAIAAANTAPPGVMKAVQGLVNPTPTPITGNPIFDAVVSNIPVVGALMKLTGLLQDLGVPSAPVGSGLAQQASIARQSGGIGQQGQGAAPPANPILSALIRTAAPPAVQPPAVTPQPVVVTTQGGVTPAVPTGSTVAPPPVPGLDIIRQGRLR